MKKRFVPREIDSIESIKYLVNFSGDSYKERTVYRYIEDKETKVFTYNDLKQSFNCLGTALFELGLNDKKVALCLDQHPYWITSFFSVIAAGGVIVPLDRELKPDQLAGFINLTD